MPDLLSHLLIGLILAELFNIKKKSLVLLGAITPDIMSKFYLVYFYFGLPPIVSFISFHTPLMSFLLSLLVMPLFKFNKIKTVLYFNIGSISHYLSDLTMKHFTRVGTRLFFPFSNNNYTLNLIWPEKSAYILIATLLIYILIKFIKKRHKISN